MTTDTMSSEERLMAAISLERPDRVPIAPFVDTAPAARLLGLRSWEIVREGFDAQLATILKLFDELGGWDGVTLPAPPELFALNGMRAKPPSEDSPENQMLEREVWTADEYDVIVELGWQKFLMEHLVFRVSGIKTTEEANKMMNDWMAFVSRSIGEIEKRGATPYATNWFSHPFFWMSLTRSMVSFTEDLYYRPERVEKAIRAIVPEWIELAIALGKSTQAKIIPCVEERAGCFFYPLKIFKRFWWPYTLEIVDALWSEGFVTLFHLDQCWDKNLTYFKQLPKGSAILDLDGTTDIFAAKEVLGSHLCLGGDVHPALLSLGKPEEVESYCKRLIDEVGRDGGLILNVGCSVPYDAKMENLRVMIETGKTYESSRR